MPKLPKSPEGKLREARYAYYRRCQLVMRNGEQCRCPAEKGEPVCRNHRQQWETNWRHEGQRFQVLARVAEAGGLDSPDEVFADPKSVQKVLFEVGNELVNGTMESKPAKRLLRELTVAVRLFKYQR